MKNPVFLYKKIKLCDDCFVNLNSLQHIIVNNQKMAMQGDEDAVNNLEE